MKKVIVGIFSLVLVFSMSLAAVEGSNKTIKVNKVITDEIEQKGEVDYFSFYTSKPGSIQIQFDFDVSMEYTVKLIDEDENRTIQTTKFNSKVNTVSGRVEKTANKIRLDKGNYQVQVSCSGISDEEYELKVIYDEENSDKYEKESNNDAKTAMLIDYNTRVIGNLEYDRDVDYFMVEIPDNGEIYTELEFDRDAIYSVEMFYELNGSLKSLNYKKYEAKLNQNSDTYFDISERVRVPEGNYYFKISRYGNVFSNEDYEFLVRYNSNSYGNYEVEYNNEAKDATEIVSNTEFYGNLTSKGDVDFYTLSVWNANKLKVRMNVPNGAIYNVTIYKEVNGELSKISSDNFGSKTLSGLVTGKEQEVTAGNYYFKVVSKTYSNSDYSFLVETNNVYDYYNKTTIVLEINNPYMLVNNVTYPIDDNRGTAPVIVNSRTMLPIRAIIEKLGGNVTWVPNARGININLGNNNVYLTLDNALAYVNGQAKYLDVAPASINGRTMVPVKFVMDNLGGSVIWNATTGSVTITY